MDQLEIIPPFGGLSDALTFDAQPLGTSSRMLNTSSMDPVTKRKRFGPRAGCEPYNANKLATADAAHQKVQLIVQSVSDNQRRVYAPKTTAVAGDLSAGETVTPSKDSTVDGVPDGFGNFIAIDGKAALVQYNSEFVEVWRFSLPVKDDGQICRAIAIDPFGNVYVGVSDGGTQSQARLWAFSPDADLHLKLRWGRQTDAFVERLRWQDGYLYSIENDIEGNRAYYTLYSNADTATPTVAQRKDVTAPVGDFVVNKAGAVVTTHPPSATRRLDPRYPDYSYILDEQRWTPAKLADFKKRISCHLTADDLATSPDYTNLKDGDSITVWRDHYGSQRKLIADPSMSSAGTPHAFVAPKYVKVGPCGRPAVRFSGDLCRLISEMNPSEQESMADLQRTILPGYKTCGYVVIIVCKPSESSRIERLISQTNTVTAGVREMWVNWDGTAGADAGFISTDQGSNSGTAPSTVFGRFSNKTSMAIITMVSGNGHYPVYGAFDSAWRINGNPLAEFEGLDFYSAGQSITTIGCKGDETRGFTGDITDIFVLRDYTPTGGARTLCTFPNYPVGAFDPSSDTEIERLEGYFAWKAGIPHMLDDGEVIGWGAGGASTKFKHPFCSDIAGPTYKTQQGPPNPNGRFADNYDIDMLSVDPLSVKWSPQRGNINWTNVGSGQGSGIAIDDEGNFYTVGPMDAALDDKTLRKWVDRGGSVTNQWNISLGVNYSYAHARLVCDKFNNIYVPFHWAGAAAIYSLAVYDKNGLSLLNYKVASSLLGYSVAIDPAYPDYGSQSINLPEFVYLFTRNTGIAANATIHKIRLVTATATTGSVRNTVCVGVCAGNVVRFVAGASAPVAIAGGASALSNEALPCGIPAFGKVWLFDGTTYLKYDPVTDIVTPWKCTSAGALPQRARWGVLWNGRAWLIRCPGDPHNWHASTQGDFENWDTNPANGPLATQAISGNDAEMGIFPDIPNTLIPWTRERMIVGCDHSIQLVSGDPMVGGSITEVSQQTGASFGPCWCLDDQGALYFFGSRGGVYRMTERSGPESISDAIQRRLMDIDLSLYYVQLAWNSELDELHVMEMPYSGFGVARRRWRWQKELNAWHQDTHSNAQIQPTCFVTYDADLVDDRAFIMGCEDGIARNWSRDAKDDHGYPIDCQALFGPYGKSGRELRIGCPSIVLAKDQDGCNLEFFASETADDIGEGVHRTELVAGRNQTLFRWLRGSYGWLRFSSALAGNRWAFEAGTMRAVDVGRAGVRS